MYRSNPALVNVKTVDTIEDKKAQFKDIFKPKVMCRIVNDQKYSTLKRGDLVVVLSVNELTVEVLKVSTGRKHQVSGFRLKALGPLYVA